MDDEIGRVFVRAARAVAWAVVLGITAGFIVTSLLSRGFEVLP